MLYLVGRHQQVALTMSNPNVINDSEARMRSTDAESIFLEKRGPEEGFGGDDIVDGASENREDGHSWNRYVSWRVWRPLVLTALALLILGWWISATVLKATRGRW